MRNSLLYGLVESKSFVSSGDEDHDFLGVHDGTNTHSQSLLRNFLHVAVEETGVGNYRVLNKFNKSAVF